MKKLLPVPKGIEEILDKVLRIHTTTDHRDILEAMLADIGDAAPIIGELSNLLHLIDAVDERKPIGTVLLGIDLVGGAIPMIGFIFDIITPTNTLLFLTKELELPLLK